MFYLISFLKKICSPIVGEFTTSNLHISNSYIFRRITKHIFIMSWAVEPLLISGFCTLILYNLKVYFFGYKFTYITTIFYDITNDRGGDMRDFRWGNYKDSFNFLI